MMSLPPFSTIIIPENYFVGFMSQQLSTMDLLLWNFPASITL